MHTSFGNTDAQFSLFAYDSKLCETDKAVILRAVFNTDDTYMDRGEVVEIGLAADSRAAILT
jgi:hypothetical protein